MWCGHRESVMWCGHRESMMWCGHRESGLRCGHRDRGLVCCKCHGRLRCRYGDGMLYGRQWRLLHDDRRGCVYCAYDRDLHRYLSYIHHMQIFDVDATRSPHVLSSKLYAALTGRPQWNDETVALITWIAIRNGDAVWLQVDRHKMEGAARLVDRMLTCTYTPDWKSIIILRNSAGDLSAMRPAHFACTAFGGSVLVITDNPRTMPRSTSVGSIVVTTTLDTALDNVMHAVANTHRRTGVRFEEIFDPNLPHTLSEDEYRATIDPIVVTVDPSSSPSIACCASDSSARRLRPLLLAVNDLVPECLETLPAADRLVETDEGPDRDDRSGRLAPSVLEVEEVDVVEFVDGLPDDEDGHDLHHYDADQVEYQVRRQLHPKRT